MRQLHREFRAAVAERGADTRRLVVIYTVGGAREFVTGSGPLFGAPASVAYVSPHGTSIDPWTRALSISERHVRMRLDEPTLDMLSTEHVAGCRIEIYLGTATLPRARWVREWWGQILDAVPEGNAVTVRAGDIGSMLRGTEIRGSWVAQHHLDIVRDVLTRASAPTELYDDATFDPRLYPAFSHWALSRAGLDGVNVDPETPTPNMNAWTAIQELVGMTGGALRFDERQRLRFEPWDGGKAPVRHWTADKISNFRVVEIAGNRADELVLEFGRVPGQEPSTYRSRVPGAAALHRFEGHGERPASKKITLPWVHGRAEFSADIAELATSLTIYEAERNGLCGFRYATFGQPQRAWDAVSAERRAYLLIEQEIVEVFSITSVNGQSFHSAQPVGPGGVIAPVYYPLNLEATITVARGMFGTARVAHPWARSEGLVTDVTIPIWMARDRARFAHGAAVVEFDVPLTELDVELLDFVTFDQPRLVFPGCRGADSTHVWEVIGQTVDEGSSTPSIHVVLLYAYNLKPTGQPVDNEVIEVVPVTPPATRLGTMTVDERNTRMVVEGLLPVAGTGRQLTIPEGSVDGTAQSERQRAERTVDLAASRDHYVRWNMRSRAVTIEDVAVNAAAPALRRGVVPLAMVRTDATSIVSVTDQRPTRPLDGARLVDASVPSARIAYPLDTEVSVLEGTALGTSRAARRAAAVQTVGATTATVLVVPMVAKTAGLLRIEIGASRAATDDSGAWRLTARVVHDGTGAAVAASTAEYTSADDGSWSVAITPSGDDLHIRVTGVASQTIRWTAAADLVVADTN